VLKKLVGAAQTRKIVTLVTGTIIHLHCSVKGGMFPSECFARIDVASEFYLDGRKYDPITIFVPKKMIAEHNGQSFIPAVVWSVDKREAPYVRIRLPGESEPELPAVPFEWLVEQKMKDPFHDQPPQSS
jgi:hypothetical protein